MISFSAAKCSIDENRNKTGLLVGLTGIIINCLIFVLELFSGMATGSTTLMADAFHNLIDSIPLVKAHEVTSRTELDMKQQGVDLVIHFDPVISQDFGKELS